MPVIRAHRRRNVFTQIAPFYYAKKRAVEVTDSEKHVVVVSMEGFKGAEDVDPEGQALICNSRDLT